MKKASRDPVEHLAGGPAIEKIRSIAKSARICLFGTVQVGGSLNVRPIAVQAVDNRGCL